MSFVLVEDSNLMISSKIAVITVALSSFEFALAWLCSDRNTERNKYGNRNTDEK